MADDFCPTVIQQTIPDADITPLERLLLSHVFLSEKDGEGWYFYSDQGPSDIVWIGRSELQTACSGRIDTESEAHRLVAARLNDANTNDDEIEIELIDIGWPRMFQDIVCRSASLPHVSCITAFTSSRLGPNSIGGQAMLITADRVWSKSTFELLDDFRREATAVQLSRDEPRARLSTDP